ncbi:MAG: primosomal protein N' [Magnetococcales bacterium]|nr:primosomal protein N' [Magnetococcales bacterium]
MFAEIALPIPKRTLFTYAVPDALKAVCKPGCLVLVPVGNRFQTGVVWRLSEQPAWQDGKVRALKNVLNPEPLLDEGLRHLLDWMARYYLKPLGTVVAGALPKYLRYDRQRRYTITEEGRAVLAASNDSITDKTGEILSRLSKRKKGLTEQTLSKHLGKTGLKSLLTKLEKKDWIHCEESWKANLSERDSKIDSTSSGVIHDSEILRLTDEQYRAVGALQEAISAGEYRPFLLEGVTGSGKTEVYFRAIETCLEKGRQVLFLVPEIGLTTHLVERFRKRFHEVLAVFHSGLSDRQRFEAWQRVRANESRIVVGARSALFAPFSNLGLIVVDEEHDSAYKQEGGVPYQGRDMAVVRAHRANATLILGSATPSLESMLNADNGRYTRLKLMQRATGAKLPEVILIDLRKEIEKGPKGSLIGNSLHRAIADTVDGGRQVLLFLNRRGFAPSLICSRCGSVIQCPNCSVALTYHKAKARLVCHHCDHWHKAEEVCPTCGQLSMVHFGPGTERLEEEVGRLFPEMRIARLDRDTVSGRQGVDLESVLNRFRDREIDLLIGTQMAAKGFHFPGLSLVGVIMAETTLFQPDFRAAERTFQLITQVAGRAGREKDDPGGLMVKNQVLVQTYDPENPVLQAAINHDMRGFLNGEMPIREEVEYPPFNRIALLRFSCINMAEGVAYGQALIEKLPMEEAVSILGPAPAPIHKLRNKFRWQLLIKEEIKGRLHGVAIDILRLAEWLATSRIKVDLDIDPYDFY